MDELHKLLNEKWQNKSNLIFYWQAFFVMV
jgi:hypothetical protein